MGNSLQDLGKLKEAIKAYEKALSIRPNYADASNNMGNALQDLGKPDKAIMLSKQQFQSILSTQKLTIMLGVILQETGNLDEAVATYTKAISLLGMIMLRPITTFSSESKVT